MHRFWIYLVGGLLMALAVLVLFQMTTPAKFIWSPLLMIGGWAIIALD